MELEKKLGINIDPQEAILSISDSFRAIWARTKIWHAKNLATPTQSLTLKSPSSYGYDLKTFYEVFLPALGATVETIYKFHQELSNGILYQ